MRYNKPFSIKWSADLAYVVGLITTDGCLSGDRRHISMTSKDIELIEIVKKVFNAKNKVGFTKNKTSEVFRVQIGNVGLYDWLESLGLHSNKSRTIKAVKVPDEYFSDFVRGHLDGDGSVTTYTDRYNTKKNPKYIYNRLVIRLLSGSKDHIIWLQENIIRIMGIHGKMHEIQPNKNYEPLYIIKYGKKDSLKLISKMYYTEQVPSLIRKRKIVNDFLLLQKNERAK